ncbi:MAG: hypothetical protein KF749_08040 [Bacteroidetes bacterium]|nr:hypothetical protein [Bacteroidota bacterium]MCW5894909.1 hypothetical protein [Bacteroidota bacterium]
MDISRKELDEDAIRFKALPDGFVIEADYSLSWSVLILLRSFLLVAGIALVLNENQDTSQFVGKVTPFAVLLIATLLIATYFSIARQSIALRYPLLTIGVSLLGMRFKVASVEIDKVVGVFPRRNEEPLGSVVLQLSEVDSTVRASNQIIFGERLPFERCKIIAYLMNNHLKGAG